DITCSLGEVRAAIELKCFRKVSKRAVDIDMYNVLKDIERLQAYEEFGIRKFICLTDYSFYSKADHKGHAGSVSIKDGVSYKKGKPIKPSWIGRWKLKNRVTPIRLTQNISFKWINKEGWYYIKLDI
ncbi:MAG: hypothetical protein U9P14_04975, partial [Gemmatimonadota bacterium]|nr:hypothetical protein [Gemmatimonadota bacterium]